MTIQKLFTCGINNSDNGNLICCSSFPKRLKFYPPYKIKIGWFSSPVLKMHTGKLNAQMGSPGGIPFQYKSPALTHCIELIIILLNWNLIWKCFWTSSFGDTIIQGKGG